MPFTWMMRGLRSAKSVPDAAPLIFGDDCQAHIGVIRALLRALGFANPDAAFLCDRGGVDHIDIRQQRRQQAAKRRRGEGPGIEIGDCALIFDLNLRNPGFRELTCKTPKLISKNHIRLQQGGFFCA